VVDVGSRADRQFEAQIAQNQCQMFAHLLNSEHSLTKNIAKTLKCFALKICP
jgi:hypothetical protein